MSGSIAPSSFDVCFLTLLGIEPRIFGSVDRRLIHWAIGPGVCVPREIDQRYWMVGACVTKFAICGAYGACFSLSIIVKDREKIDASFERVVRYLSGHENSTFRPRKFPVHFVRGAVFGLFIAVVRTYQGRRRAEKMMVGEKHDVQAANDDESGICVHVERGGRWQELISLFSL